MSNRKDREHDRSTEDATHRQGDILGLGGSAVPKTSADPAAAFDDDAVSRRRARARGADEAGEIETDVTRSSGATSIDMGAGGSGTDVE